MNDIFETYECLGATIEECRRNVEAALNIKLAEHSSSYFGVYFRAGEPYGEEVLLQKNLNEVEGTYMEKSFPEVQFLLSINLPSNPEEIRAKLAAFQDKFRLLDER